MSMHEYEVEPIAGVPGVIPANERIIWQGRPDATSFLVHVLHIRWILGYFGALTLWRFGSGVSDGMRLLEATTSALWLMPLWLMVVGLVVGFGVAVARTTIYTITSKRLIMRYGVALPMAVNVPFSAIESGGLKVFSDGTGQLPLQLDSDLKLAYLVIWPHARPHRYLNPEPMLRSIRQPEKVAKLLADAYTARQKELATEQAHSGVTVKPTPIRRPTALRPLAIAPDRSGLIDAAE